ncbi:MAG: single-stranded DNA-binding protein [Alphaproteobacteria bacterium]
MLLGVLVEEPGLRQEDGASIVDLRMDTSDSIRHSNDHASRYDLQWHRVTILAPELAAFAQAHLHTGDHIYVEGQLRTHRWRDVIFEEHVVTEIVVLPDVGQIAALGRREQPASASTTS